MGVTQGKPMDCIVYEGSRQGRRSTMEDTHRVVKSLTNHPEYAMYGVFDGHNGIGAAKYLETKLCDIIDTQLGAKKAVVNPSDVPAALSRAFCQLDAKYIAHCLETGDEAGSTAVIALLNKGSHQLFVANVGDARCIIGAQDGSAEALSIDHKPMLSEERARIEAAGHMVEEMRLDGMLAVSRAIGDIPFKLPRDLNLKPEDKALSPVPYIREKHINVSTGDERMRVNDDQLISERKISATDATSNGGTSGGRNDSDNGISLMRGANSGGDASYDAAGHGLTHSTMRPHGGTYSSSTSSAATSITTSAIFGLPRVFPDLSVAISTSSSATSSLSPPISPIPPLPAHLNMAALASPSSSHLLFPLSAPAGITSPVMFSPSTGESSGIYHNNNNNNSYNQQISSIFSTFSTISLSRALSIPVPQAPSYGEPIVFSPNPSRSVSPSISSVSSSSTDGAPPLLAREPSASASSSSTHLSRSSSAPAPVHAQPESDAMPSADPRLVTSISLFGRGATAPPPTSFAPRPLFPVASSLPMSQYTFPSSSTSSAMGSGGHVSVPTSPSSPSRGSIISPMSSSTPLVNTYQNGSSPMRSPSSPPSPTPPTFALTSAANSSFSAGPSQSSSNVLSPPSPGGPQRTSSFVFASPSPARLPPRHGQPPAPLFLRSVSAPNPGDATNNNTNGNDNDAAIANGNPSLVSQLSTSSASSDGSNGAPSGRSVSSLNVSIAVTDASTSNVLSPSDATINGGSTSSFLASPSIAANYGVSIGGTHRQQSRRPFSLVGGTSSGESISRGASPDNNGAIIMSSDYDVTSGNTLGPSRAYSTPAAVRDAALSVPSLPSSHHSSGMAHRQHKSAADVYDGSRSVARRSSSESRKLISYRAVAKACPTLEIDGHKSWQFLVLACDGLFDVMTNQQVVDWVNNELRLRARAVRAIVRHHLADCGVPADQLFDLHHDDNGNGGEIASLVATSSSTSIASATSTGMMTGYGTSINRNSAATQAEWEEMNRRIQANAKEAKETGHQSRAVPLSSIIASTTYGRDEFISLDSLATDLCDAAIRKGSTDNVSVLIVMLEQPPCATNKKLIQKLQARARREMDKDRKRAKEQARAAAKDGKKSVASSTPSVTSASSKASQPSSLPLPSAPAAAAAAASSSTSSAAVPVVVNFGTPSLSSQASVPMVPLPVTSSNVAGIGHGTSASPAPSPTPAPVAAGDAAAIAARRQLMHLGPSGRVDDPELTIFASRTHKKEPSVHINALFKT